MKTDNDSIDDEHRALRASCGLAERPADLLELRGDARTRFLNGYVTCDVKSLEDGAGVYGFVTEVKGHVLADVRILALEESLWLDLPAGKGEEIAAHLGKYALFDRVEIAPLDGWTSLAVAGPDAAARLEDAPSAPYVHREVESAGTAVRLVRDADLDGVPAWTLWSADAAAVQAALAELGVRAVGPEAFERLRIEAGRPRFGQDFDGGNFPQETGLEDAVSYDKGCYLGQEVVARIHYRGAVNRQLRGLRLDADGDPVGRELVHEGRAAGTVTSATRSPAYGHVGLAVVHKRVEPGAEVELAGGGTAGVVALPFTA